MKNIRRISALALALMLALAMCVPGFADGASKKVQDARNGVVRVYAFAQDGTGASGTGFGVGKAGEETDVFVTNWHVVTMSGEQDIRDMDIYVAYSDDAYVNYEVDFMVEGTTIYSLSMGGVDKSMLIPAEIVDGGTQYPDVAVIRTKKPVPGHVALPLRSAIDNVEATQTVYTIGYPSSADSTNYTEISRARLTNETGVSSDILDYYEAALEELLGTNVTGSYYKGYDYASSEMAEIGKGAVSKMGKLATVGSTECISHSAHINHGNSGGPLVDEDGAVIGINTYGFGDGGNMEYSISIYIDYAMDMLDANGIEYDVYREGMPTFVYFILGGAALLLIIIIAVVVLRGRSTKKGGVQPSKSAGRTVVLKGNTGVFAGRSFSINGQSRLGRDGATCNIVFPKGTQGVSGQHCEIMVQGQQVFVQDLGSTYGTMINGSKIPARQPIPVQPGTSIQLGSPNESFILMG